MPPKKNSDPNKPKGRTSAYAFFVQEKRNQYRLKGEAVKFSEFSKACAEEWKKCDEDDKAPFVEKAELDKVRHDSEIAKYVPPPGATGGKTRRNRKKKDPNAPKRPLSAFIFFSQDKRPLLREQNPKAGIGEIAKELGKAWKVMTEDQKEPFEEKAKDDRSRYEAEKESYVAPDVDDDEDDEEDEDED